jgi:hypothetical protein
MTPMSISVHCVHLRPCLWRLVALLCLAAPLHAADVLFDLSDWKLAAITNRSVLITPAAVQGVSGRIVAMDRLARTTGTNGTFWISNMVAGIYQADIQAPPSLTRLTLNIPDTNGPIRAADYTTNQVSPTSGFVTRVRNVDGSVSIVPASGVGDVVISAIGGGGGEGSTNSPTFPQSTNIAAHQALISTQALAAVVQRGSVNLSNWSGVSLFSTNGLATTSYADSAGRILVVRNGTTTQHTDIVAANAAMQVGDTMLIGPGVFYLTTNIIPPRGSSIIGAGRKSTVIVTTNITSYPTPAIASVDNGYVAHLTITNALSESTFTACLGTHAQTTGGAYTNWLGRDLLLYGASDTWYNRGSNSLIHGRMEDSELHGGWDIVTAFGSNGDTNTTIRLEMKNCRFVQIPKATHGGIQTDIYVAAFQPNAHAVFEDCYFYMSNGLAVVGPYFISQLDSKAGSSSTLINCTFEDRSTLPNPGSKILTGGQQPIIWRNSFGLEPRVVGYDDADDGLVDWGTNVFQTLIWGGGTDDGNGATWSVLADQRTVVMRGILVGTNWTGNGVNLTNLNASALSSGTVPAARLGTGTANSGTYLRGDGTWSAVVGGGGITNEDATNAARGVVSAGLTNSVTNSFAGVVATQLVRTPAVVFPIAGGVGSISNFSDHIAIQSHAVGSHVHFDQGLKVYDETGATIRTELKNDGALVLHGNSSSNYGSISFRGGDAPFASEDEEGINIRGGAQTIAYKSGIALGIDTYAAHRSLAGGDTSSSTNLHAFTWGLWSHGYGFASFALGNRIDMTNDHAFLFRASDGIESAEPAYGHGNYSFGVQAQGGVFLGTNATVYGALTTTAGITNSVTNQFKALALNNGAGSSVVLRVGAANRLDIDSELSVSGTVRMHGLITGNGNGITNIPGSSITGELNQTNMPGRIPQVSTNALANLNVPAGLMSITNLTANVTVAGVTWERTGRFETAILWATNNSGSGKTITFPSSIATPIGRGATLTVTNNTGTMLTIGGIPGVMTNANWEEYY